MRLVGYFNLIKMFARGGKPFAQITVDLWIKYVIIRVPQIYYYILYIILFF